MPLPNFFYGESHVKLYLLSNYKTNVIVETAEVWAGTAAQELIK